MPSPFPGMDPYLEHPRTWPNIHHRLITAIAITLGPQVRPKYRVVVEEAIYQTSGQDAILIGVPDVTLAGQRSVATGVTATLEAPTAAVPIAVTLPMPQTIRQSYLEIRDVATDRVVTVLEVLSPVNKRSGSGRKDYLSKCDRLLGSSAHLIEIDLLRQWQAMPMLAPVIQSLYCIMVSCSSKRPQADLYAFNLADRIPRFTVPLADDDAPISLDLKSLLDEIYDQSGYDLVINYTQPPEPPLKAADTTWAQQWLSSSQG